MRIYRGYLRDIYIYIHIHVPTYERYIWVYDGYRIGNILQLTYRHCLVIGDVYQRYGFSLHKNRVLFCQLTVLPMVVQP